MNLTEEQREIILHSLGSNNSGAKLGFRNYFCTTVADPELEALVALGLMKHGRIINEGRDQYYIVTDAGKTLVGCPLEVEK